jgi:Ser/Thr protein kinase RdoA (MazF antagonist)
VDSDDLVEALPDLLRRSWGLQGAAVIAPIHGGMNSTVAEVRVEQRRYVAKWVPAHNRRALEAGARTARRMAKGGLLAGEPRLTSDGSMTARSGDGAVALLSWVPGNPLRGLSTDDQVWMATTLAHVHRIGGSEWQSRSFFVWVRPDALGTSVQPWIKPAVAAARAELDSLPALTWGVLHTDPAPEAFLLDEATGAVGLIDWTGSTGGPLLYDVASAVMYLGGRESASTFLRTYAELGPIPTGEIAEHLGTLQRFRAAVQAVYFAQRIASRDLTGISDDAENWTGLHDARAMFSRLGVATSTDPRTPEVGNAVLLTGQAPAAGQGWRTTSGSTLGRKPS